MYESQSHLELETANLTYIGRMNNGRQGAEKTRWGVSRVETLQRSVPTSISMSGP